MPKSAQRPEEFDAVRRLVMERLRERRLTLADASRHLDRNQAYMHQFIHRHTPKRLPEEVRGLLANLLGLPEDALRHPSPVPTVTVPPPKARGPLPGLQPPVPVQVDADVSVFTERDEIDSAKATEAVGRPPLLGNAGPLFALWIASDHGSRLRAGDLAFVRVNQPARPGDPVVVLSGKSLVCVGDLLEAGDHMIKVNLGRNNLRELPSEGHQVLKVACVVLP